MVYNISINSVYQLIFTMIVIDITKLFFIWFLFFIEYGHNVQFFLILDCIGEWIKDYK